MARVYETMRKAEMYFTAEPRRIRFTIRLWIDGLNTIYADNALSVACSLASAEDNTADAAEAIATVIDGLNAVEVLDGQGNGSLIYPEWP